MRATRTDDLSAFVVLKHTIARAIFRAVLTLVAVSGMAQGQVHVSGTWNIAGTLTVCEYLCGGPVGRVYYSTDTVSQDTSGNLSGTYFGNPMTGAVAGNLVNLHYTFMTYAGPGEGIASGTVSGTTVTLTCSEFITGILNGTRTDVANVSRGQVDLFATSLKANLQQGGYEYSYQVDGGDLTAPTTVALYWASGPTWADVPPSSTPAYSVPIAQYQGTYGPLYVPFDALADPPQGLNVTHLLLVVDPPATRNLNGFIDESDETNNVYPISALTLGEKASILALRLWRGTSPYLFGAKGWAFCGGARWVKDYEISFVGYGTTYVDSAGAKQPCTTRYGLDCSGLVMWAYNTAFGGVGYLNSGNPMYYESADGQWRYNCYSITKDMLEPGDLLFFDKIRQGTPDGVMDHVAMYVGDDTVVEAYDTATGMKLSDLAHRINITSHVVYFSRPQNPRVDFQVRVYCPVGLVVEDPDGNVITPETLILTEEEALREIPGELYYAESDLNGDGDMDSTVYSPKLKIGRYLIKVVPKPGAAPTAAYHLELETPGGVIVLADGAKVGDIPAHGYGVMVSETGVVQLDLEPPVVSGISATPSILPVPNHKMAPVRLAITATDNSGFVTSKIVDVSSNEPVNGLGEGDQTPDWEITEDLTVNLRAERAGTGSGRVYTITVECTDDSGNKSQKSVNVTVPHDQGKK